MPTGRYLPKSLQTLSDICSALNRDDEELTGSEDPSVLHSVVANLPAQQAYKEGKDSGGGGGGYSERGKTNVEGRGGELWKSVSSALICA